MTLIKSISGIRGTIGGKPGDSLTPVDAVKFASAFGSWIIDGGKPKKVLIGRDARISGEMVSQLVAHTLSGMGIDVIDAGLSTTPSIEWAVVAKEMGGGIILTASHNPTQWNALKLLNDKGEFISSEDGAVILSKAESGDYEFADVHELGEIVKYNTSIEDHVEAVLNYPGVDTELIRKAGFKVVVDAVNSTGGIAIPYLLEKLGIAKIEKLNCDPTGHFAHNPEPLPEHLGQISAELDRGSYDLGLVVDPDVDRLAIMCEDGSPFGEEYTLVAVADYILDLKKGPVVSNLSSSRALRDLTESKGGSYHASAVGEVNVVNKMKEVNAVVGGEGNGGIIIPDFHYGRDALIGAALFLTLLAKRKMPCSSLKAHYPDYFMSKNRIELEESMNVDNILDSVANHYKDYSVNKTDGVKIDFEEEWVHLRKSNTEPIIRIYAEAKSETKAETLAEKIIEDIREILGH